MVVMGVEESVVEFQDLPEGCIACVLSFTTPRDVCRLSAVSSAFRSASESDTVWESFLPSDYPSIISQSSSSSSFSASKTKQELYLNLCDNPLLVDDGQKSFQLDKAYGKKCYMISARTLFIVWGDTPRYWRWTSLPEARFSEVAELVSVCWLEIRGWINMGTLSPETLYGAYLVFKPSAGGAYGFVYQSVEVSIGIVGAGDADTRRRTVFLDPERGRRLRYQRVPRRGGLFGRTRFLPSTFEALARARAQAHAPTQSLEFDLQYPKDRPDGWLEMELGDFFNEGGEDKELEMGVYEVKGGDWKGGLVIQGIEMRPKLK